MFLSRLWMVTALRHFQPPVSTAHNARMALHFGGCFRQDLLMKRPHNFIDAQNATTLGAIMPNRKNKHTQRHTLCPGRHLYIIQIESGFNKSIATYFKKIMGTPIVVVLYRT
jgi:hypothetical protein